MSDPNAITGNTSAYTYPQYQGQPQGQPSQQTQIPQTPSSTVNANRGYQYSINQYQYDQNAQLQSNQAYGQYQSQPQTYSQVYQQPYQYQQLQPSTQTPTQAPIQQQNQQTPAQATDYSNAVYQNANRSYQSYGSNSYGYPNTGYLQQPTQTQYMQSSGSNMNMTNTRGPLSTGSQPPAVDPTQIPQRPKLTTTFWEDENTVCYQVESRGISVSRREDTNFINGTKLLNVAGMTRGRRDGILKSEKMRYVVKIGAMNLKGVWIPFERAVELARNEGIVDLLYPLFVEDIKELYQGPQYSGGPTAAANNNKTITPVTVTNTTYTPSSYGTAKDKKKIEVSTAAAHIPSSSSAAAAPVSEGEQSQVTQPSSQVPASTTSSQPASDTTSTTAAQQSYNQYSSGYQTYQQPGVPASTGPTTSGSDYKPNYYNYGANTSTPQKDSDSKSINAK